MLAKLLFVGLMSLPGQVDPNPGQVSSVVGQATLRRDGSVVDVVPGTLIRGGDAIEVGPQGRAGILFEEGHLLTLGGNTSARLQGTAAGRTLLLDRGEARITAGGDQPLVVVVGATRAQITLGILRASSEGVRFQAERGIVEVSYPGRSALRLEQGREISLSSNGVSSPAGDRGWTIRSRDLQSTGRTILPDEEAVAGRDDRALPPLPGDDPTRSSPDQPGDNPTPDASDRPYQPIVVSQPAQVAGISLALGNISSSSSAASSGAAANDAQQDSRNLMFPGNVHLVTSEARYQLTDVRLRMKDGFPTAKEFYSIGLGSPPTSQVSTDFLTGTKTTPTTIRIPRTDAYLVKLDQFGIKDTGSSVATPDTAVGIFGLLGETPIAPQVRGARPLLDNRSRFNNRATFALGELALERDPQGKNPIVNIRRSDQDRRIIKSPLGDDSDIVTPNIDVRFTQVFDGKFFPDVPKVFVPAAQQPGLPTLSRAPTYGSLGLLRKAAATTLMADALNNYSRRTQQTRFVVDNRVVDITGYNKNRSVGVRQIQAQSNLMRSGHAAPGMAGGPGPGRRAALAASVAKNAKIR